MYHAVHRDRYRDLVLQALVSWTRLNNSDSHCLSKVFLAFFTRPSVWPGIEARVFLTATECCFSMFDNKLWSYLIFF